MIEHMNGLTLRIGAATVGAERSRPSARPASGSSWSRVGQRAWQRSRPRLAVPFATARSLLLPMLWLIIAAVATYDCYATVKYAQSLPELELNPVGRWLMDLGAPGFEPEMDRLALFLACKVAGTIAVLSTLQFIERVWRRWSLTITSSIASTQIALGAFLVA